MKFAMIAGLACAAALTLAGCASPGGPELSAAAAVAKTPTPADPVAAQARLDTLKEANRHIELCHRTYAWPISFIIDCQPAGAAKALTAEDVAKMIAQALAAAKTGAP